MQDKKIVLRQLQNTIYDYKKLEKWYKNKEVYLNFEQRILSLDEIKVKYLPRTFKDSLVPVLMILYGNYPVGIIQYQRINNENKKLYNILANNVYEVDIFIGEINYHNRGIGRKSINLLTNYLFNDKNADMIVMCPLKNNYNAIKCYENCGFKVIKSFKAEDTVGDIKEYLLMVKNNKEGKKDE